jgi:hypothetical protein
MIRSTELLTYCFESYGVSVRIESNSGEILDAAVRQARSALLGNLREIDCSKSEQVFTLNVDEDGICRTVQNGRLMVADKAGANYWHFFDGLVRLLVADFAPSAVFVHAGVVGWRGKAIVIPGNSFQGKTTLVAELVKSGAEYYSDEYAVIDETGLVSPYARKLSIRTNGETIREDPIDVRDFGGVIGTTPIPVACVLFTRYEHDSAPNFQIISTGQGIVGIIAQTIGIRRFSEFRIKVLKNALSDAIIVESPRPDAGIFARDFLEFVDNTAF